MLFDSKSDTTPKPPVPPQTNGQKAASSRAGPSPFEPAASPQTGVSVIGTDLTILGDKITIISQNKLQVDGDVRGNVHGKHVVITDEGSVVGMVSAETIERHEHNVGVLFPKGFERFPKSFFISRADLFR